MYKLYKSKEGNISTVIRLFDNACIPFALDNTDYQTYLKWLEDPNNKPIPADE